MKRKLMSIFAVALAAGFAYATAATGPVNTPARTGLKSSFGVYTNVIIYAGTMVALNSSGYAVPAANASGYAVVGRASKTIDNRVNNPTVASGASNAQKIEVERGVFGFATDNITVTSVGSVIYVLDDKTVTTTAGSYATIAGILVDYSGGYAWVDTFNIPRAAGTFTTLSSSGAASLNSLAVTTTGTILGNGIVGGTLVVTGAITGPISAANLTAGTVASAIDGSAITNLDISKLASGKTAAAFNGSAITALTAANVGTVAAASAVTNLVVGPLGTTNTMVLYPFGGGYIIKSFAP